MHGATGVQYSTPKNGAKLLDLMSKAASYYPVDEGDEAGRIPLTIRFQPDAHKDLQFIADLWNDFDKALGRKRERKWKVSTVVERLVALSIVGFWEQVGGRPTTDVERKAFAREALDRLMRAAKAK